MNPLNRRMFRQPGMSRQPAGILASSPQLANTVANRQPVRMATGGLNGGLMMSDVQKLVQNKDIRSLAAISQDGNVPSSLRLVARNAAERLSNAQNTTQVSTEPTVQNTIVPKNNTGSLTSPPVMSVRGSGDSVTIKAAPPMMSYDGPSEGALARRDALAGAPAKIKQGLSKGIEDIKTGMSEAFAAKGPVSGVPSDPAEIRSNINSAIASLIAGPRFLQSDNVQRARNKFLAEDEVDFDPNINIENPFNDPNDFVPEGPGETMAEIAVSRDTVGTDGSDTAGSGSGSGVLDITTSAQDAKKSEGKAKKPVGGGRLMDSIYGSTTKTSDLTKALEADITEVLELAETGRTKDTNNTEAATVRFKAANEVFNKALGTKMAEAKEFSLEDVRDEALKISGVDDSKYDDSRKDAFWMGLMRAGLAIAAGESENALSNVAKGLGVGLEGYGKDISTLNEQEREDRKEVRAISMDLIKTKNAREIALSTAKNDYTFNQQRLAQETLKGADAAVIAAQNRENTNKLTGLQLQANLNLQLATRKADDRKLALDTAYKQWAGEISMLPTEAKQALMFGPVEYNENGSIKLSALQQKEYRRILEASTTNKTTVTDTLRSITNAAANGQIRGVKLSDDPTTAQVQASQWFSVYQKEYDNAAKDFTLDENKVLTSFAQDIGGTAPSGSGNNPLQPGQEINISDHPQKDSLMKQKENEPFKIKGIDVVRKGSTIVVLSPTK